LVEIGQQLRERREMLSLSLEEIERHTRMRARYMQALESGEFDELPSTVQTRGMLNSYASFLDLDVDAILLRFADALQTRHRERFPEKPTGRRTQPAFPDSLPRLRTFIAGDLVFGLGMILLLATFAIWGISRVIAIQSQTPEIEPVDTNPSISEALIGTPVEEIATQVSPIPVADTPIPEVLEGTLEIPAPVENVAVQLNIVVLERTYLRVRVDGEIVFDGRALPGNAYPFEAEQSVDVLAGNAAALRVTYNQRDLGLLGGFGELVNLVFTAEEILTPTPEPTPTPTETQPVTPSPTLTPSETPTPSIGGESI
jgi:cytoskeletal protein RodZ